MLYADDLIVVEDSTSLQLRFGQWQRALETKGLKYGVEESISIVDNKGSLLKQVETFRYLGSVINAKGRCEKSSQVILIFRVAAQLLLGPLL